MKKKLRQLLCFAELQVKKHLPQCLNAFTLAIVKKAQLSRWWVLFGFYLLSCAA